MAKNKEVSFIVDAKNKAKGPLLEVKRDFQNVEKSASKSLREMSKSLRSADSSIYGFSNRLNVLDTVARRTFQGIIGSSALYTVATLRDFSQLNDGISKTNTLYQQTKQSQDKMFKDAININKVIPTDYTTITQGFYDSISSGADPKYASMVTRKFGIASVGGDTDIPVVTKAAMGTMNAFGKEIKDLDHILDVQFSTVKNGIVEYEQLASSLETGVLKSADNAGISIEELYGAIAGITKNAIPANVASTSLVQLFNKFTDAKAIKDFKKFGVDIQDTAGHTRRLTNIFKDLNEQFEKRGMTKEQRAGFLKKILGSDEAVRALQPLLGDLKEFDRILGEMKNSDGSAMNAYEDRLESMGTQLKLLWNNFKSYGMESIYALSPLLNALMETTIKKQKLTVQKMNLEDKLEFEDDPTNKAMIKQSIALLETQIKDVDLTPVEKFHKGLADGVAQLEKINPPLAKFVETIGNFTLDFFDDEDENLQKNNVKFKNGKSKGQEKIEEYKGLAKVLGGTLVFKKIVDMYKWFNESFGTGNKKGAKPGESLASTLKTMNVNANIVNVYGKSINSKGNNLNSLPNTPTPIVPVSTSKPMLPGTSSIPALSAPAASKTITEGMKKGAIDLLEVTASESTIAFKAGIPILAMGVIDIIQEGIKNYKTQEMLENISDYSYILDTGNFKKKNIETIKNTEAVIYRTTKGSSVDTSFNTSKVKENARGDKLVSSILNKLKDSFKLDNKVDVKNEVQVDAPKVINKIYVDGKSIPIKKVETSYDNMGKQVERNSRRYSGTTR